MSLDSRLKMCYSEGSATCSLDLALDLVALVLATGAPMLGFNVLLIILIFINILIHVLKY